MPLVDSCGCWSSVSSCSHHVYLNLRVVCMSLLRRGIRRMLLSHLKAMKRLYHSSAMLAPWSCWSLLPLQQTCYLNYPTPSCFLMERIAIKTRFLLLPLHWVVQPSAKDWKAGTWLNQCLRYWSCQHVCVLLRSLIVVKERETPSTFQRQLPVACSEGQNWTARLRHWRELKQTHKLGLRDWGLQRRIAKEPSFCWKPSEGVCVWQFLHSESE